MHITFHTPPNLLTRLQVAHSCDVTAAQHVLMLTCVDLAPRSPYVSGVRGPDGNLQVLVWRHRPVSCCKPLPDPRWWAGYANPDPSSVFLLALTKVSNFTEVWASPCATLLQGLNALMQSSHADVLEDGSRPCGLPRLPTP